MRAAYADGNDRTVVERHDPLVGAILDQRFRIDYQLAAGGFGAIYRATDVRSDAAVALKVLHPQLARDPSLVARFRREGKTLATLRDPHTITAYEVGQAPEGTMYIVLELLHGETLYQRFRTGGPMAWQRVVHIALGMCSSLAEAHGLGIIHRDLKPANIHLETRDGDPDFVKVLDFGIAKIVHGNDPDRNELTQAGQMIGTVDYMSPEQMVGDTMAAASDIYTLGVVVYEMIAGRTPFAHAQNATAILAAVLTQAPEPLSAHAAIPPALDQIVARCLEREPANRFATADELAEALAKVLAPAAAAVPSSGFELSTLTTEATRIDVRFTNSSMPVLDARGPRRWPAGGPPPAPDPHAMPSLVRPPLVGAEAAPGHPSLRPPHAVGSQHAIDARGLSPVPSLDGRGRQPMVDAGGYPIQAGPPGMPAPGPGRPRAVTATPRSYDMTAATSHDALVRRIIWFALFSAVLVAFLVLR
jgi:serine/threonine protein kinase